MGTKLMIDPQQLFDRSAYYLKSDISPIEPYHVFLAGGMGNWRETAKPALIEAQLTFVDPTLKSGEHKGDAAKREMWVKGLALIWLAVLNEETLGLGTNPELCIRIGGKKPTVLYVTKSVTDKAIFDSLLKKGWTMDTVKRLQAEGALEETDVLRRRLVDRPREMVWQAVEESANPGLVIAKSLEDAIAQAVAMGQQIKAQQEMFATF